LLFLKNSVELLPLQDIESFLIDKPMGKIGPHIIGQGALTLPFPELIHNNTKARVYLSNDREFSYTASITL
jgi:hypothetical protein